ncbi:unnamed protein product [Lactuca virosa]|uniref:Uncharacterized protein n=1 Tax=Lactuca virosa TaxID=75947 RepID=A0AAU9NRJ2_9ASTR|nr:unnamed protein product [Lactuca virosa]
MMRHLIPLSQKGSLEDLGKMGGTIFDQFSLVRPAIPRRDGAPLVSGSGGQDGAPPVSESGDQDSGLVVNRMKRTKIMARRGRKNKVSGPMQKTPKKAHRVFDDFFTHTRNGKQPMSQVKEDMSLSCDEAFDDAFAHTPNGKKPMSQENEDV